MSVDVSMKVPGSLLAGGFVCVYKKLQLYGDQYTKMATNIQTRKQ